MPRVLVRLGPTPTREEIDAQRTLTITRIRGLTGEEAKALLEDLIERNESTGIVVNSREFVDKLVMSQVTPPKSN
jgi:hypothetical protein